MDKFDLAAIILGTALMSPIIDMFCVVGVGALFTHTSQLSQ